MAYLKAKIREKLDFCLHRITDDAEIKYNWYKKYTFYDVGKYKY
jgi:hypothetical protein